MKTIRQHLLNASRHGTAALALACIAAVALPTAQAQTTRVWSGPTNGQYNNTANWTPSGTWANGDTLRYNGSVGGNLSLNYQGGQNTGVSTPTDPGPPTIRASSFQIQIPSN